MKLYLDSTNNRAVIIKLDAKEYKTEYSTPQDQDVLGFLIATLKLQGRTLKEVTEVEVNRGPGSFTGTRVGVSIANALAFALGIKVNGQKPPILPLYSGPPSITVPKK